MPITSADLKLFASQNLTDAADGGGRRGGIAVQDGVSNNLFANVSPVDRAAGRVHLRKVYQTVVSANRDMLLGAHVVVSDQPTDPNIDVVAFRMGDHLTQRAAAQAWLDTVHFEPPAGVPDGALVTTQPNGEIQFPTAGLREAGDLVALYSIHGFGALSAPPVAVVRLTGFIAVSGFYDQFTYVAQFGTVPNKADWLNYRAYAMVPKAADVLGAWADLGTAAAATDTEVDVSRVLARVNPSTAGFYQGLVPIFRAGGLVYIEHATVPATNELVAVERVLFDGRLRFTTGLINAYPVGSKVCSAIVCGDLQASVGASFSQQTWTRVFSDTLIGNGISAQYNRVASDIAITNEGAATERWAILFTSATTFRLIGESVGQIASGDTATTFSPLNPFTNQPYFTIPAAGWGTGWGIGNVLRYPTVAAEAPVWAARCVSPSVAGGTEQAELTMRGAV